MKKYLAFLSVAAMAGFALSATAQEGSSVALQEGTRELALSGNYDPDAIDDFDLSIEVGYGQFIVDNLELGAKVGYQGTDHTDLMRLLGFAEYNFPMDAPVVPYVRASGGWIGSEIENDLGDDTSNDTAAAAGAAGLKYFITDTVAAAGEVEYTKATDDVFVDEDAEAQDDNVEFNLSLRFYIP
jgi:hypothetical protein